MLTLALSFILVETKHQHPLKQRISNDIICVHIMYTARPVKMSEKIIKKTLFLFSMYCVSHDTLYCILHIESTETKSLRNRKKTMLVVVHGQSDQLPSEKKIC